MGSNQSASERIIEEVGSWPGVTYGPGSRGELSFKLGKREIGHLHGDRAAHLFLPPRKWDQLRSEGRIVEHPVFPGRKGPAAREISDEDDIRDVIELMRWNYDRAVERFGRPEGTPA